MIHLPPSIFLSIWCIEHPMNKEFDEKLSSIAFKPLKAGNKVGWQLKARPKNLSVKSLEKMLVEKFMIKILSLSP